MNDTDRLAAKRTRLAAKRTRLATKVTTALGRYNLAKAARADRGARIESAAEARARRALDTARDELRAFDRDHPKGA
jgi:hypothetical protein